MIFGLLAAQGLPGRVLAQDGRGLAEVVGVGGDWRDDRERARVVSEMRVIEEMRVGEARKEALRKGLPFRRVGTGGRVMELVDWLEGQPVYVGTTNANAAISTGANLVRVAPFGLTGAGVRVGVWDGGGVRTSHQEFGGRVTAKDGASVIDHATHVAGTIAASGVVASARGMATAVGVDSYDWNNDTSEMTARGAAVPGDVSRLYVSNHSYNYISGWNYVGTSTRVWEWHGTGTSTSGVEDDFGRYNTYARDADSLAYNAPYYLMFRSAGNERIDQPSTGQQVALSPGGSPVAYDPALHPKGDGVYRGGFDTIGFNALAKNVITVGSVDDAVTGGLRDPAKAVMSSFSSWGPTDDGRIKPDLVANGLELNSSVSGSDSAYLSYSGTSMATPNACGSAALLIELYGRLFPGQAMRSSTLKGLLIHTATDRGAAGPDYRYGWGLLNAKAAADVIQGVFDQPDRPALIESSLSTTVVTRTHSFVWDGVSPIRATLGWIDPAGTATTAAESRTPRLVNNLNLKVVGPGGSEHLPFVMPFVGTWTQASMDLPATTGINVTDNIEQVVVAAPPAAGVYQAVVTYSGVLANNSQNYSLILTGTAPSGPLPPSVVAISPDSSDGGNVTLTVSGSSFAAGATLRFTLAGQPDVAGSVTSVTPTVLTATVNTAGMTSGRWSVVVTNPNGQSGTLVDAFALAGTLWRQNFDSGAPGWTTNASLGTTQWALATSQSHSPATSWFAAGPATRSTDNLVSESIAIPADASRLRFSFWHRYALEAGNDGGVLEFSVNGGTWFQVGNSGTGESIISGGYTLTLNSGGNPNTRNQLAGRAAWSGTNGSSFSQVVVALNDLAKYAGKSLRARWRLATNGSTASPGGWYVDSASLSGVGGVINQPPSVTAEASATPAVVTDVSVGLSVSAVDDGGEAALRYTWSATGGSFDRPVSFSENGSQEARTTTASFSMAGDYVFRVSVRDAEGLSTESEVALSVQATPTGLSVSPSQASVEFGGILSFGATLLDQFGDAVPAPVDIGWSVAGGGVIDAAGVFNALSAGGPFVVTASSAGLMGTAEVTVTPAVALVGLDHLQQTYDGSPKAVGVTTDPPGLAVTVTYDGGTTEPTDFGTYAVAATVADPNYSGSAGGVLRVTGLPIADWRVRMFSTAQIQAGQADDAADPDHDGWGNLEEYALGSNPLAATPALSGRVDPDGLALVFTRPKALPDVEYRVEASPDLLTWILLPLTVVSDGPVQTVRAVDVESLAANRRFLHLRVVRAPGGS